MTSTRWADAQTRLVKPIPAGQPAEMRLISLTALAMLAFAANSVLNRMAVGAGLIDPLTFALLRLLAGAAMLGGLVLLRRRPLVWVGQGVARGFGVAGLLTYLIGFSLAYAGLDAGTGALILFGMVQITMFAGALMAGEAVPGQRWIGATIAFAGLIVLLAPGATAAPGVWAVVAMAVAGVGWGAYSLAGAAGHDALGATAANFLLAVPVMVLVWSLLAGDIWTGQGAMLAVISGALTSGLGYALWYAILPLLGSARAAVAQLTVPIIAAAGGVIWIGEGLGPRFVVAAALVLGGVALSNLRQSALPRR